MYALFFLFFLLTMVYVNAWFITRWHGCMALWCQFVREDEQICPHLIIFEPLLLAVFYDMTCHGMYGILLDDSKAFDHVKYCRLFKTLLDRKVCPHYCRLLLSMYVNQKLRIRWETTNWSYFNVSNGIYMDSLLMN